MAKNIETPSDVQIASMEKHQEHVANVMHAGEGTPWEDRGSLGFVPAFFKTMIQGLLSPGRLLANIRRPDAATDTRILVLIYGVFWAIAWLILDILAFRQPVWHETRGVRTQVPQEFDITTHGLLWLIHAAIAIGGLWLLMNLASKLFYKLATSGEMKAKAPPILIYNVMAYCLAPSVLSLFVYKLIGPLVAAAWIVLLIMYAAMARLAIKLGGAIVCTMFSVVALLAAGVGIYWLAYVIYVKVIM